MLVDDYDADGGLCRYLETPPISADRCYPPRPQQWPHRAVESSLRRLKDLTAAVAVCDVHVV